MHQSCLFEVDITHSRIIPKRHTFRHRHFMFWLDLDSLESNEISISQLSRRIYDFRQTDYLPEPVHIYSLKQRVINFLRRNHIEEPHKIFLLTNVRTFGYIFNPISLFICYDVEGRDLACVAEVGNTFGECKPFLLLPDSRGNFTARETKFFYVSPFSDVTDSFSFNVRKTEEQVLVSIDTLTANGKSVSATLNGFKRPLTRKSLLALTALYPLSTLRVIALIHYHALLLWLKNVPYTLKEHNALLQKPLYRSHSSVANSFAGDK